MGFFQLFHGYAFRKSTGVGKPDAIIIHLYGDEITYVYVIADANVLPQNIQGFFKLLKKISPNPFIVNYGGLRFEASYADTEISKMSLWILARAGFTLLPPV